MNNTIACIWERWKAYRSPVIVPDTFQPQPAEPALRQEQFADNHAAVQREENRMHAVYQRVVAVNNSAVDRHEGRHTRDYSLPLKQHHLDALREDSATPEELEKLMIKVVDER